MSNNNKSEGYAYNIGKIIARQLTKYLLGKNTSNFKQGMSKSQLQENIKLVLSMANYTKNFKRLSNGFAIIPDSYDPDTKAYTAIDINSNSLLAVPDFLIKSDFWEPITARINQAMRSYSGERYTYPVDVIRNLSLKKFLNGVTLGEGTSIF